MAGEGKAAPAADDIRRARLRAGLTQADAASLVHANERLWRYWEGGKHRMPLASWELFSIKLEQLAGGDA